MSFTIQEIELLKKIDFYNRFKSLSNNFQFDNSFEDYSTDEVLNIIEKLGYKSKFIKNGTFFKIESKINNIKFYFHICLKYGLVELIIGGTNIKTDKIIVGGIFGWICKDIEISENREQENIIKKPKFRNYQDLQEILKEAFIIYEDFKREVLKLENE